MEICWIDWDQLNAIAGDWPSDFMEIFQEFLLELPGDFSQLEEAISSGDADRTAAVAHRTKGCAANFGFAAVRNHALELEIEARNGSLENAPHLLKQMIRSFEEGVAEIQKSGILTDSQQTS